MRCEPILRELAAPTGALEPAEMAEHLANCAPCAEWAERTRHFDRIWDTTRPAEPSKEVWDALWSEIARKAEAPAPPLAKSRAAAGRPRARLLVLTRLGQAAVLMIAGVLVLRGLGGGRAPGPMRGPEVAVGRDEAQPGSTLFICLDARGRRVESESRITTPEQYQNADDEDPVSLAAWDMELINSFEGAE